MLITVLGLAMLKKVKISSVIGASVSASLIFFLVSNFGCWIGNVTYPQTQAELPLATPQVSHSFGIHLPEIYFIAEYCLVYLN